jgi:succinate dehydrogenase (ubiquinone) flavoprotein subunit
VVFGRACANRVEQLLKPNTPHRPLPPRAGEASIENLHRLRYSNGRLWTAQIRESIAPPIAFPAALRIYWNFFFFASVDHP